MGKGPARLVLVTGGTGYVGSVLVPKLATMCQVRTLDTQHFGNSIADTPNVESVKGDIRNMVIVGEAMKDVTDVIHLAAIVTDELVDMNPDMGKDVNIAATGELVRIASNSNVDRFIYASSSSVYGAIGDICTEGIPPLPMTEYAKSKLLGEYAALLDFPNTSVAVRSATMCGPAPRMRLDTIVNIFSKQAYYDKKITVWGGGQWRSNIHVEDIADLYIHLLNVPADKINGEVFNATRANHTAWDIALLVSRVFGGITIEVDASKSDDRHYRMDASKLQRVLDWCPVRDIETAVADNIAFFESGGITDPNDPIYSNTRRMKDVVTAG